MRALRARLGVTQDAVADRGGFPRAKMSKFESGDNAATTADAQMELADGFGLSRETIAQYLDEELTLDDLIEAMSGKAHSGDHRTRAHLSLRRSSTSHRGQSASCPLVSAGHCSGEVASARCRSGPRGGMVGRDTRQARCRDQVSVPKLPAREASPLDLDETPSLRGARKKRSKARTLPNRLTG